MTVYALPAIPGIASLDWDLERNVAKLENPFGRTIRRVVRSGDRWRCQLRFPLYKDDDSGVLTAWMAQISRGDGHFYLSPAQNAVRGNWSPLDLVTNGTFMGGVTTGWTPGANATLSVNTRRLKILTGAGGQISTARQNIVCEAGKPHILMADGYFGNQAAVGYSFRRQSDNVSEASTTFNAPARAVLLCTPTVSGMYARLDTNSTTNGHFAYHGGVSVVRCLQVAGGSQTGDRLNVDGGPASINAALKAGEFVGVLVGTLYQLLRLVEDFDTDSAGAGTLVFEPTLRGSPADNAAVIVRYPFVRMMVDEHLARESLTAPNWRGLAVDAIEDLTP